MPAKLIWVRLGLLLSKSWAANLVSIIGFWPVINLLFCPRIDAYASSYIWSVVLNDIEQSIKSAVRGDSAAFRDVLDYYYSTIYKMAFTFCRNKHDAEDVTQICCLKLSTGIQSFKGDSAFTSWLYRIVFNAVQDYRQQQSKHKVVPLDDVIDVSGHDDPEKSMGTAQAMQVVYNLPVAERDAVLLVFGQGLSHREAGLILGCAESTVSWRIHEARKMLKKVSERGRAHG